MDGSSTRLPRAHDRAGDEQRFRGLHALRGGEGPRQAAMPDTIFLPGGGWLLRLLCPDYSYNPSIGRIIADNLMLMGIDCVTNS